MEIGKVLLSVYGVFVFQSVFLSHGFIHGQLFSIFPIFLTFYGMRKNRPLPLRYVGLFLGFLLDVYYGERFGFFMLLWFLMGAFGEKFLGYLNSNSFLTAAIHTGVLGFLSELFEGFGYRILGKDFTFSFILKTSLHEVLLAEVLVAGALFLGRPALGRLRRRVWKRSEKSIES